MAMGSSSQLSSWKLGALKLPCSAEVVGEHYPVSEGELKNAIQLVD